MADSNLFIVNIVELQNVVTDIRGIKPIDQLQADVANLQQMVQFDTKTILADAMSNFTADNKIEVQGDLNLSNTNLYKDGVLVTLDVGGTGGGTTSNTVSVSSFSSLILDVQALQTSFSTVVYSLSSLTFSTIFSGNTSVITNGSKSTIQMSVGGFPNLTLSTTGMLQYVSSPTNFSTGVNIAGFLYVSEDAWVRNLYQTSDESAKMNIQPFTTTLDDVLRLEPKRFNWKATGEPDLGFLAQSVDRVWPELTTRDANGQMGLAYSRFVPLLLEGLRELRERVESLEDAVRGKIFKN
jgi:hypothetical protein